MQSIDRETLAIEIPNDISNKIQTQPSAPKDEPVSYPSLERLQMANNITPNPVMKTVNVQVLATPSSISEATNTNNINTLSNILNEDDLVYPPENMTAQYR
jgi:hypothetical protein